MRYRPGQKDQTRRRILAAASRRFKEKGYAASGLSEVMGSAGLTVGGFYAHFGSKEDLLAEALELALDENAELLLQGLDGLQGEAWLLEVVRRYLSRTHRDAAAQGCPAPVLAAEVGRAAPEVRQAFERSLLRMLSRFAGHVPGRGALEPQGRALATMALMVGGILLARAVHDPELSETILRSCRRLAVPPPEPPDSSSSSPAKDEPPRRTAP